MSLIDPSIYNTGESELMEQREELEGRKFTIHSFNLLEVSKKCIYRI